MPRRLATALPLVEPIIPDLYPTAFDDPAWLFEPKYDGLRGLLYLSGRECRFRSKRGNVLRRFEQLCHWVREELPDKDMILDGEVVSLDEEGRQDFPGADGGPIRPRSPCASVRGSSASLGATRGSDGIRSAW